jgi:hypothetical protein
MPIRQYYGWPEPQKERPNSRRSALPFPKALCGRRSWRPMPGPRGSGEHSYYRDYRREASSTVHRRMDRRTPGFYGEERSILLGMCQGMILCVTYSARSERIRIYLGPAGGAT